MVDRLLPYVFFLGLLVGILSVYLSWLALRALDRGGVFSELIGFVLWSFIIAGGVCVVALTFFA